MFAFTGAELDAIVGPGGLLLAVGATITLLYIGYKHFKRGAAAPVDVETGERWRYRP